MKDQDRVLNGRVYDNESPPANNFSKPGGGSGLWFTLHTWVRRADPRHLKLYLAFMGHLLRSSRFALNRAFSWGKRLYYASPKYSHRLRHFFGFTFASSASSFDSMLHGVLTCRNKIPSKLGFSRGLVWTQARRGLRLHKIDEPLI
jgi:hypothetical protein